MSPRGRGQAETTRQQLMDAAMRKFAEKSFLNATTAEIAREAGVSEKTLFDLFGDKKTLYLEVRENIRSSALAEVLPRLPIGGGAPAILRALGREFLHEVSGNRTRARVSIQAITAIDDPEIKKSTQDFFRETEELIKRILVDGQQAGLVRRDLDLDQFAWTYSMALQSVGFMTLMQFPGAPDEEASLLFLNRLVDTIVPRG